MNEELAHCPFCHPVGIVIDNDLADVILDNSPVNLGHSLIIPKRHVANFFLTTDAEKIALFALLDDAKYYIDGKHAPTGYNVGINVDVVAGQTIMHVHLHLIPRYHGDMENPRGGNRGVIPTKQNY